MWRTLAAAIVMGALGSGCGGGKKVPTGPSVPPGASGSSSTGDVPISVRGPEAAAPASGGAGVSPSVAGSVPMPAPEQLPPVAQEDFQGKRLELWYRQLFSPTPAEALDAIYRLQAAGSKAAFASPKLRELAQSKDPEIAEAAQTALKRIAP